jgi:hypothetical protein
MLDKNEYGSLLYSERSCARAIIGRARAFTVFLMPQSLEIVRKVVPAVCTDKRNGRDCRERREDILPSEGATES